MFSSLGLKAGPGLPHCIDQKEPTGAAPISKIVTRSVGEALSTEADRDRQPDPAKSVLRKGCRIVVAYNEHSTPRVEESRLLKEWGRHL